jgi:arsenate reductase
MKTNPREILIYYNPTSSSDRKTVAFAKSLTPYVRTYSHDQAHITTTEWHRILAKLDMEPKRLFNKSLPDYIDRIKGKEFDDEGWLNVLKKFPHLIKSPIAFRGNKAIFCKNPTDIYKL